MTDQTDPVLNGLPSNTAINQPIPESRLDPPKEQANKSRWLRCLTSLVKKAKSALVRLAARPPTFVASSDDMVLEEKRQVASARGRSVSGCWWGLALSGGGIRSATFGLGVLQALSAYDLTKRFDYLSSVSGGGYIASALQWWWSDLRTKDERSINGDNISNYGSGPNDFPFGTRHPSPNRFEGAGTESNQQRENLSYLRNHSNYLLPGNGINIWSAIAVIFRTPFLNLLVWIPIAAFIFFIINNIDDAWQMPQTFGQIYAWFPFPDYIIPTYDDCRDGVEKKECLMHLRATFVVSVEIVILLLCGFVFFSILLVLSSRVSERKSISAFSAIKRLIGATFYLAAGEAVFLYTSQDDQFDNNFLPVRLLFFTPGILAILSVVFDVVNKTKPLSTSYVLRRSFEFFAGTLFPIALLIFSIGILPVIPYHLLRSTVASGQVATGGVGLLSIVIGLLTGIYGYYVLSRNVKSSLTGRIAASIGAAFFIYSMLSLSYVLAVVAAHTKFFIGSDNSQTETIIQHIVLILSPLGLVMSFAVNINQIGLHRYYRDRLMEAFMPSTAMVKKKRSGYSSFADGLILTDLWPQEVPSAKDCSWRPYPIINTNAVLVNDSQQNLSARGGDSFILSPIFVGSSATGWDKTSNHFKRYGPITLASAMAASGAAANANAGYIGTGLTRNRLVSMAMILLNMRLGLWVGSPSARSIRMPQRQPNHWRPGLGYALFRVGFRRSSAFAELSDGGHFENLGLYELIRRRVQVILIVDGEADPSMSLSALVSAARRVNEDFEATIVFDPDGGPDRLFAATAMHYPQQTSYAAHPYIVAEIRYKDGSRGVIIYLKALVIKELSFVALGYKAKNPEFPNQTTLDQFFTPDQFEAYRELGYQSMLGVLNELDLRNTISCPSKILERYRVILKQSEMAV